MLLYSYRKGVNIMNKGIKYDINLILSNLVNAIEQSGLSYGEIARRTGIPKSSVHRYAQGETKKIPIDAVRLIADAVGVPTSQIMGWEEKETPETSRDERLNILYELTKELSEDELTALKGFVAGLKANRKPD